MVRQFGGSRAAALIAGLWFVATMARFFEYYVGMNEPQLLGQAVMVWGLVWLLKRHAAGRAVEPAVLVMVLAGFVKHNFIVVPVVALVWVARDNWRLGLRAAIVGAAAAAVGLALCAFLFAPHFVADMLMPRTYELMRSFTNLGRLQFILPALVLWAIWAWPERSAKPAQFTALMIGAALIMYMVQKAGSGVDENAQFELVFAAAIGIGLAYDRLPNDPLRTGWSANAIRLTVLGVLIARLLLSTRLEFAAVLFSPQYRAHGGRACRGRARRGRARCRDTGAGRLLQSGDLPRRPKAVRGRSVQGRHDAGDRDDIGVPALRHDAPAGHHSRHHRSARERHVAVAADAVGLATRSFRGRAQREPGIHNHEPVQFRCVCGYGFRCRHSASQTRVNALAGGAPE